MRWVSNRQATTQGKPDPPQRIRNHRPVSLHPLDAAQTICRTILANIGWSEHAGREFVRLYAQDMIRSCDPEPSILVFRNTEYLLVPHRFSIDRLTKISGRSKWQTRSCRRASLGSKLQYWKRDRLRSCR